MRFACSIGRTGRKTVEGYNEGRAISFFSQANARLAAPLCDVLREAGQDVPRELEAMAASSGSGGRSKFGGFGGGRGGGGYRGGGAGISGGNSVPLGRSRY